MEGSAGVSQRALRGLSEGSTGSLEGKILRCSKAGDPKKTGFSEVFRGLVTLCL